MTSCKDVADYCVVEYARREIYAGKYYVVKCIVEYVLRRRPGAGFMNRRRLCQLTAAILTSDLTTHMWVL